ncbi:Hypothetical predicted protein [Cloeon dipterum]|uniref:Uncharacterized protein n=1 Tax=Cloeon dipterum TaxID=197152 RepID=A0A8S1CSY8_9INSE|nr:Hypothetical predicted protein [Cloeon dipterum]
MDMPKTGNSDHQGIRRRSERIRSRTNSPVGLAELKTPQKARSPNRSALPISDNMRKAFSKEKAADDPALDADEGHEEAGAGDLHPAQEELERILQYLQLNRAGASNGSLEFAPLDQPDAMANPADGAGLKEPVMEDDKVLSPLVSTAFAIGILFSMIVTLMMSHFSNKLLRVLLLCFVHAAERTFAGQAQNFILLHVEHLYHLATDSNSSERSAGGVARGEDKRCCEPRNQLR